MLNTAYRPSPYPIFSLSIYIYRGIMEMNSVINPDSGPKITLKKNLYDVLRLWLITYKSKATPTKTVHSEWRKTFTIFWQNSWTSFEIFIYFQVFATKKKKNSKLKNCPFFQNLQILRREFHQTHTFWKPKNSCKKCLQNPFASSPITQKQMQPC